MRTAWVRSGPRSAGLNGNQTSITTPTATSTTTYRLDNLQRTTRQTTTAPTTAYTYDGTGNRTTLRTATTTGTVQQRTAWDTTFTNPATAVTYIDKGTISRRNTAIDDAGLQIQLAQTTPNGTSYLFHDWLGSITDQVSSTGAPEVARDYEPYGTVHAAITTNAATPSPLQYTGETYDADSSTQHLRLRQYDPAAGILRSTDTVEAGSAAGKQSAYTYVNQRPTTMVDPSGAVAKFRNHFFDAEKRPGYGQVKIDFYIQACVVPTSFFNLDGDCRASNPDLSLSSSLVVVSLDYETGQGYLGVNISCVDHHSRCWDALPVHDSFASATGGNGENNIFHAQSGHEQVLILALQEAAKPDYVPAWCAHHTFPSINDAVRVTSVNKGLATVELRGDPFPTIDVYHYHPDEDVFRRLVHRDEHSNPIRSLLGVYGSTDSFGVG